MPDDEAITWMHFSDLHLGKPDQRDHSKKAAKALLDDIKYMASEHAIIPDFIFFTGDLIFGGETPTVTRRQMSAAKSLITDILTTYDGLGHAFPRNQVFLVPGNHDVASHSRFDDDLLRTVRELAKTSDPNEINAFMTQSRCHTLIDSRLDYWRQVVTDMGMGHLFEHDAGGSNGVSEAVADDQYLVWARRIICRGLRVGIAGFNTAWTTGPDGQSDKGGVVVGIEKQLDRVHSVINRCDVRIAMLHHPRNWWCEIEDTTIWERLTEDYDFVLQGHEHYQRVLTLLEPKCTTIYAGAAYLGPHRTSGYNYVTLDPNLSRVTVWHRYADEQSSGWAAQRRKGRTDDMGRETLPLPQHLDEKISSTASDRKPPPDERYQLAQGLIAYIDTVDLSALDADAQRFSRETLDKLSTAMTDRLGLRHSPTPDGFVFFAPQGGASVRVDELIPGCLRLLQDFFKTTGTYARSSIHIGSYYISSPIQSAETLFGTTVSEARRMARHVDGGHVCVSESALSALSRSSQRLLAFQPSLNRPAVDLHGPGRPPFYVRVLKASPHSTQGLAVSDPARWMIAAQVGRRVQDTLKTLERYVVRRLREFNSSLTRDQIDLRVSLLERALRQNEVVLRSTSFRYHADGEGTRPGQSVYYLGKHPTGVVGHAYASGRPVVQTGLPQWSVDPNAKNSLYKKRCREFKIPSKAVDGWQRHARAFWAFPFGTVGPSIQETTKLDGVGRGAICLDFGDPLSDYPHEAAQQVLEKLRSKYGKSLSEHWAIRELALHS